MAPLLDRRGILVLLCLGFFQSLAPVYAHERDADPSHTPRDAYEPTPRPDRVCLTWSGDPRHSISVTWRTHPSVSITLAEFVTADSIVGNDKTDDIDHATKIEGQNVTFTSDAGDCRMHTATFTGLAPATMYAYRVGDGDHWSEWFQFKTAASTDEEFTFVYFGDAQNAVRSKWSRVIREANQHAPRAAFMLHAGDLVNSGNVDSEWGEWFEAAGWLNGMIPVVASPGNHEYPDDKTLSRHWRPQFAFPQNGPSGLEDTVYWFDYQGARLISLNSSEQKERQARWLEEVLQDENRPKWTIVTFHHPIFSAAKERDNRSLRTAWRPALEKYGVDLVLQGHDHAYNRSSLGGPRNSKNIPEGVRRKNSNTVYVVSVSGPKMYTLQEQWEVERVASGIQLFQVIRVSPDGIHYEARTATGTLYDAFTLTKSADGISTLVEKVPDTDEIRE